MMPEEVKKFDVSNPSQSLCEEPLSVALRQLSLKGEPRLASHPGGGGIAKSDDGEGKKVRRGLTHDS